LREKDLPHAREALGLEPQDVLIPGSFVNDPISRDPQKWLQTALANAGLTGTED
jgi:hypothetical protein